MMAQSGSAGRKAHVNAPAILMTVATTPRIVLFQIAMEDEAQVVTANECDCGGH